MIVVIIVAVMQLISAAMINYRTSDLATTGLIVVMMMVGVGFLYMCNKTMKQNQDAKLCLYQGYEMPFYYFCCFLIVAIDGVIILNLIDVLTLTSPLIMIMWLFPLITYMFFQATIVGDKKVLRINNQEISYKKIKQIKVEAGKGKDKITIITAKESYYYKAKAKQIALLKDFLMKENKQINA